MLSRVERCAIDRPVERFEWIGAGAWQPSARADRPALSPATAVEATPATARPMPDFAALERDAFVKGYAQGERAGNEAAAARGEAMLRRLALTIDELAVLRAEMIQKTERQLVQLAVAIARKVTRRELTIDSTLLSAMARVALDRLGESSVATIRLHPGDLNAITSAGQADTTIGSVRVIADPAVAPGGCVVQADFGLIDVGLDAQLAEISSALIGSATGFDEAGVVAA
jgi:flagellar assembly protein FliH